ncbi:hypothetical protein [Limnohabitans sp. 2KL-3]|uniref:hypothetical protein n=1 Tax=Limnohabitans sp. 2KL-3 TaxID=1100700 RepID=UPI000AC6CC15|nr:hypothetical protein [Limnohabitans sp. 2KL-3]
MQTIDTPQPPIEDVIPNVNPAESSEAADLEVNTVKTTEPIPVESNDALQTEEPESELEKFVESADGADGADVSDAVNEPLDADDPVAVQDGENIPHHIAPPVAPPVTPLTLNLPPSASHVPLANGQSAVRPVIVQSSEEPSRLGPLADAPLQFLKSKKSGRNFVAWNTKGVPNLTAIGSAEFNSKVRALYRQKNRILKQREFNEIVEELNSVADEDGREVDLYVRVAPAQGKGINIDLCDESGRCVHIDETGPSICEPMSDVLFLRPAPSRPLPTPDFKGSYVSLAQFVNLPSTDFHLLCGLISYTIAHPKVESTNYVFTVLKGTQGSGKTQASKTIQKLIDPSTTGAQTLPSSDRELAILSQNCHLMVFDNMRDLSSKMSDALCIAATGGAVSGRQLYTDDGQKNVYLHGAILLNGIHPFMGQSDFADRCCVFELQQFRPGQRKDPAEMQAEFDRLYPEILGGFYQLIADIFRVLPTSAPTNPGRMIGFCKWLAAMEQVINLEPGELQNAYRSGQQDMQLESLLDNPLAAAILHFAERMQEDSLTLSPSDLYNSLSLVAQYSNNRSVAWPSSAASMSKRLHGLQAPLLSQGILIEWTRGKDRAITLRKVGDPVQALAHGTEKNAQTERPVGADDAVASGDLVGCDNTVGSVGKADIQATSTTSF